MKTYQKPVVTKIIIDNQVNTILLSPMKKEEPHKYGPSTAQNNSDNKNNPFA